MPTNYYLLVCVWGGMIESAQIFDNEEAAIAAAEAMKAEGFDGSSDDIRVLAYSEDTKQYDVIVYNADEEEDSSDGGIGTD